MKLSSIYSDAVNVYSQRTFHPFHFFGKTFISWKFSKRFNVISYSMLIIHFYGGPQWNNMNFALFFLFIVSCKTTLIHIEVTIFASISFCCCREFHKSSVKKENNKFLLTRASVSCGSSSVSLFRLRLFTCSNTRLKCSSALKQSLSRNEVTTSFIFFVRSFVVRWFVCKWNRQRNKKVREMRKYCWISISFICFESKQETNKW